MTRSFIDDGAHVVVGQLLHLLDLMRGPEAVEEMHERDARFERGLGGDQGHVHAFLDVLGAEHAQRSGGRA